MWNAPFDESMLDEDIIIHCPDRFLANELMKILEKNGVLWGSDEKPTSDSMWDNYKEDTCYWVESKSLAYGDKYTADDGSEYANYFRCTFYGTEETGFEIATDDELIAFLGIGGV